MSKIICDVCGTDYSDSSAQCPICGFARPANAQVVVSGADDEAPARKYEQVKGGRFSKENVRKRTMSSPPASHAKPARAAADVPARPKKKKKNSNSGLIITILVLLLAIIAVIAYIIIKFFIPTSGPEETRSDPVITEPPAEVEEETLGEIYCVDITLDTYEIVLENAGDHTYLIATPDPFDTTDMLVYESADSSIAMVESDGRVTAVSKGETFITVTCGVVSTQCKVIVGKKVEFVLNRQEIIFEKAGDTWNIYSGDIPIDDIVWSSDDTNVATVVDGVVTAVGEGVTMIYGDYNGEVLSCVVRCDFPEEETEGGTPGNGDVTSDAETEPTQPAETQPASSEYTGPFKLHNIYGSAEDVMITVGESFTLTLIDSNGKTVEGVSWSVDGSACSVSNGTIKGLRSGYCEVIATYAGQNYKCIVRVR